MRLLRDKGVDETSRVIWKNVLREYWQRENRRFDRRHNTNTGGSIEIADLAVVGNNAQYGVRYEPTPLRTFRHIMAQLPRDLHDYTFVDFGSGKGRALLLASHYGFHKIVGVEFAKDLHAIALRNLANYRSTKQRCTDIEAVLGDAAEFPVPTTPCILYFCQPFDGEVERRVLENVERSLATHPRPLFMVFLLPHTKLNRKALLAMLQRKELPRMPLDPAWQYQRELEIYTNVRDR